MEFQILSHAGLAVRSKGYTLLTDPWVLGSCYWRSWWNYPPVPSALVRSLEPQSIYLTHIHWDHFQGPSLRKFGKNTRIYVPKGNYRRMRNDLEKMGFRNVVELRHGESVDLTPDLRITSYQFDFCLDSALVIECEGMTLLNANDAKLMGGPLTQIVKRHPQIDFVLRSHSSANSRLSQELIDAPNELVDDISRYIQQFAEFCISVGATYAIPFASNQCYLHQESYHFNETVQTPKMVQEYFKEQRITNPQLQVMVVGDRWSTEEGFTIQEQDYFTNRAQRLAEYRDKNQAKLDAFYAKESRSKLGLRDMQKYFDRFMRAIPFPMRWSFRGKPITFILAAGETTTIFEVDIYHRRVTQLQDYDDDRNPVQIHTSTFIARQCVFLDLFSHLGISKRVRYRTRKRDRKYIVRLNLLFNLYEYDMLPIRRMLQPRFLETWLLRWREVILYAQLAKNAMLHGDFRISSFYPPRQRPDALARTEQAVARARDSMVEAT